MIRDESDGSYFPEGMPLPGMDATSRPFWAACNEHRLLVQRCAECGVHRSPPQPLCGRCGSFESDWSDSLGRGRVFSYTIVPPHSPPPLLASVCPTILR